MPGPCHALTRVCVCVCLWVRTYLLELSACAGRGRGRHAGSACWCLCSVVSSVRFPWCPSQRSRSRPLPPGTPMPQWGSLPSRLLRPPLCQHLHFRLWNQSWPSCPCQARLWGPNVRRGWAGKESWQKSRALRSVAAVGNEPAQGHRPQWHQGRAKGFEAQILGLRLECHICLSYPRFWKQQCIFLVVMGLGWGGRGGQRVGRESGVGGRHLHGSFTGLSDHGGGKM